MKDLQLVGGDLFAAGRGFATVTGTAYLRQRVATALAEPYGSDSFHPEWGSALESYLGGPISAGTPALITAEASRVLAQIMTAQQSMITLAALNGTRSQLSADDVIASVDSVAAGSGTRPDSVLLSIALTTQGGQQISVNRTVGA